MDELTMDIILADVPKCNRCGQCCLHSPCMLIPIGEEVYVGTIHTCPDFSITDEGAYCSLYNQVKSKDGICTSINKINGKY